MLNIPRGPHEDSQGETSVGNEGVKSTVTHKEKNAGETNGAESNHRAEKSCLMGEGGMRVGKKDEW